MFLHLGLDVAVPEKSIIGIFDLDTTSASKDSKKFLRLQDEKGLIQTVSDDIPKSFIVTVQDQKNRVYLSPISTTTLKKRSHEIWKHKF